jgi:isopenicillin N synthase-like dioxygenase
MTEPTTDGIPLLDLTRWRDGDARQQLELAEEIDRHLQRLGFLVVVNHGIDRSIIDRCRSAALEFFHQPAERKAAVAVGDVYRGWVGPGLESNAATYGIDTPPDLKETFAFGPVDVPDPKLIEEAPRWFAPNVWPEAPTGFQQAAEDWWRSARGLTDQLLEIMALGLGMRRKHLVKASAATTASVSINWYWSRNHHPPGDGQYRIGPHTDFGTLTVLDRQPGVGGLQVRNEQGDWIDAPVIDDALIVNTGDMIRQWSNDRWCSNEHRVLPPSASAPGEELLSLVFFHEPNHDTVIEPLPPTVADNHPPRYEPILAGDYLAEKMDALQVQS